MSQPTMKSQYAKVIKVVNNIVDYELDFEVNHNAGIIMVQHDFELVDAENNKITNIIWTYDLFMDDDINNQIVKLKKALDEFLGSL